MKTAIPLVLGAVLITGAISGCSTTIYPAPGYVYSRSDAYYPHQTYVPGRYEGPCCYVPGHWRRFYYYYY